MHLSGSAQHRCNAYVNEIAASPASARNPPRRRWPKRGCPLCASQPYIATSEVLISIKVTGAVLAGCLLLTCPAAASNLTLRPQSLELSAPARGPGVCIVQAVLSCITQYPIYTNLQTYAPACRSGCIQVAIRPGAGGCHQCAHIKGQSCCRCRQLLRGARRLSCMCSCGRKGSANVLQP